MRWAEAQFQGIDPGAKRRNRRPVRLVVRLAERPTANIAGACGGWAETQAAYRFLANEESDWIDILESHCQCTRARMAEHPVVLCLQEPVSAPNTPFFVRKLGGCWDCSVSGFGGRIAA